MIDRRTLWMGCVLLLAGAARRAVRRVARGARGRREGARDRVREDDGRPRPRGLRVVRGRGRRVHGPDAAARAQGRRRRLEALLRGTGPLLVGARAGGGDAVGHARDQQRAGLRPRRASACRPSTPPGAATRTASGGSCSTSAARTAPEPQGGAGERARPRLPRLRRGVPARDRALRRLRRRARGPLPRTTSRGRRRRRTRPREAELAGYRVLFTTARATDLVPMADRLREAAIEYRLAEQPGRPKDAPPRYAILVPRRRRQGRARGRRPTSSPLTRTPPTCTPSRRTSTPRRATCSVPPAARRRRRVPASAPSAGWAWAAGRRPKSRDELRRRARQAARPRRRLRPRRHRPRRRAARARVLRRVGGAAATPARWRYLTEPGREAQRPARAPSRGRARCCAWACSTTRPHAYSTEAPGEPRLDLALRLGRRLPRRDEGDARAPASSACGPRRAPSRPAPTSTPARSPRRPGPRPPGSAPGARTPACSTPSTAPGSSSGEVVTDLDLPRRRAARRHVRQLHGLPRRLPDAGPRRALRARRHALHQLPDDRGEGRDPGGAPRGRGPPRLRLRHLPGRVPVEPQAAPARRRGASSRGRAPWPRTSPSSRRLDEEAFRERFRRSPVKRAKRRGLLRNVAVALGNAGERRPSARCSSGWPATPTPSCASTPPGRCARLDARLSAGAGSSGARSCSASRPGARPPRRASRAPRRRPRRRRSGRPWRRRLPPPAIAPIRTPAGRRAAGDLRVLALARRRRSRRSRSRRCGRPGRRRGPRRTRPRAARLPLHAPRAHARVTTWPLTSAPGGKQHVAVHDHVLGQLGHDAVLGLRGLRGQRLLQHDRQRRCRRRRCGGAASAWARASGAGVGAGSGVARSRRRARARRERGRPRRGRPHGAGAAGARAQARGGLGGRLGRPGAAGAAGGGGRARVGGALGRRLLAGTPAGASPSRTRATSCSASWNLLPPV